MGDSHSEDALAVVAYGPSSTGNWKLERLTPRPIRDDEVLVRMVASGICLADVHFGHAVIDAEAEKGTQKFPRVLGHEGSGYVEQVGSAVRSVKPGDPVLLSFLGCGTCYNCVDDHPAYCLNTFHTNWKGEEAMYRREGSDDFGITGSFFGQSSFAGKAVVKEGCIVSLADTGATEEELKILAPLGCGIQTGSGAFINIAKVEADHEVAVLGVGGVGQSAIMAAAMKKCKTIIAIDLSDSRLQLAKALGATHTINTATKGLDLVAEVRSITGGRGVHASLDTTGNHALSVQSWHFVRRLGKVMQVGLARPNDEWNVSMADHMNTGKQIIGCCEGDAVPQRYVPEMVAWYRQGLLPVDRIVKTYPVADFQRALDDMKEGTAIKPVLVWPSSPSGSRPSAPAGRL